MCLPSVWSQGSYGHGKPGEVMELKNISKAWEKMKSQKFWKSHGNVWNIPVLIYAKCCMLWNSHCQYKIRHVLTFSRIHRDFTQCLVMDIWFKVLEKSWKSIGQRVYEPWKCNITFSYHMNIISDWRVIFSFFSRAKRILKGFADIYRKRWGPCEMMTRPFISSLIVISSSQRDYRVFLPSHFQCGRLCFDRSVFIYLFITFALKMRKVMFWSPCIYVFICLFVCVLLA